MRTNPVTYRSGSKNPRYIDGRKNTRLYRIYNNIKSRCYNEKATSYHRYGGRGIKICDEWLIDFGNFYKWSIQNGYEENLTIDRINNNGNYEPNNCRWTDIKTQSRNKSINHLVTINKLTKPLINWCEEYKINYKTVRDRLKRGWSYKDSLTKPVDTRFRRKKVV